MLYKAGVLVLPDWVRGIVVLFRLPDWVRGVVLLVIGSYGVTVYAWGKHEASCRLGRHGDGWVLKEEVFCCLVIKGVKNGCEAR